MSDTFTELVSKLRRAEEKLEKIRDFVIHEKKMFYESLETRWLTLQRPELYDVIIEILGEEKEEEE